MAARGHFIKRLTVGRAYKRLLLDERGKFKPEAEAVLGDLLGFCRFFIDTAPDAGALAMAEGRRQVLRRILSKTKSGEAELLRQIKEQGEPSYE